MTIKDVAKQLFAIHYPLPSEYNEKEALSAQEVISFLERISGPILIKVDGDAALQQLEVQELLECAHLDTIKISLRTKCSNIDEEFLSLIEQYKEKIYQVEIVTNEVKGSFLEEQKKEIIKAINDGIKLRNFGVVGKLVSVQDSNHSFLKYIKDNAQSASVPFEIEYLHTHEKKELCNDKYYKDIVFINENCKAKGCDKCHNNAINFFVKSDYSMTTCHYSEESITNISDDEIVIEPRDLNIHSRVQARQNYYIQYPIALDCNLRCDYCFNKSYYEDNYDASPESKITIDQFMAFKDKVLFDRKNVVLTPHGGEPFFGDNLVEVLEIMDRNQDIRYEFLTNGIQPVVNYTKLLKHKKVIDRVGFTFHRAIIAKSETLKKKFIDNILFLQKEGIKVYIKELLILEHKKEIVDSQIWWKENYDIEVLIQDVRGTNFNGNDYPDCYSGDDLAIISNEYKHPENPCRCKSNHVTIIMQYDGNILPCWHSEQSIGDVKKLISNNYKTSV